MKQNTTTSPSSPARPVDVVRGFYDALKCGDGPAALSLLNHELEWTEADRFPYYSGTWRSPEEVLNKLLIPLMRDWDGFSAVAHEFISEGNRVASIGTYSGTFKATGKKMNAPFVHTWTVRDGRITKFNMYVDSVKVLETMN
jgi:ketosteroid isomerase-like protein